jgi:hypothetical protein
MSMAAKLLQPVEMAADENSNSSPPNLTGAEEALMRDVVCAVSALTGVEPRSRRFASLPHPAAVKPRVLPRPAAPVVSLLARSAEARDLAAVELHWGAPALEGAHSLVWVLYRCEYDRTTHARLKGTTTTVARTSDTTASDRLPRDRAFGYTLVAAEGSDDARMSAPSLIAVVRT